MPTSIWQQFKINFEKSDRLRDKIESTEGQFVINGAGPYMTLGSANQNKFRFQRFEPRDIAVEETIESRDVIKKLKRSEI